MVVDTEISRTVKFCQFSFSSSATCDFFSTLGSNSSTAKAALLLKFPYSFPVNEFVLKVVCLFASDLPLLLFLGSSGAGTELLWKYNPNSRRQKLIGYMPRYNDSISSAFLRVSTSPRADDAVEDVFAGRTSTLCGFEMEEDGVMDLLRNAEELPVLILRMAVSGFWM